MKQKQLQKLLDEFGQSKIALTPQWIIDRNDRLKSMSYDAAKTRGKQITKSQQIKASKKAAEILKIKVLRYNKKGKFINKYESMVDAAKDNNTTHSNISRVCNPNDNCKTINGYVFKKQTDFTKPIPLKIEVDLNRPVGVCPHCKKEASTSNLKRWHGDNCKHK